MGGRKILEPQKRLLTLEQAAGNLQRSAIVSLFFLILVFSIHKIGNWDIWWHLKTGAFILDQGTVPKSDIFSFTSTHAPWVDLHWGFQILSHTLYRMVGGDGLILFKSLLVLLTLFVVFRTYPAKEYKLLGLALFFLTVLITSYRLLVRPEALSMLFLAIYLKVLWAYTEGRRKALYALPFLQVFWVNVHGLFVIGLFAIWSFLLGEWMTTKWRFFSSPNREILLKEVRETAERRHPAISSKDNSAAVKDIGGRREAVFLTPNDEPNKALKPLVAVGILSVLACLVNPYGVKGLLFPLTLFTRISGQARIYSASIGEFLSLFGPGTSWTILKVSYVALLLIVGLSFVANFKRINPTHLILCAGLTYLSAKSKRNINLFAIAAYPIVLYNLTNGLSSLKRLPKGLAKVTKFFSWCQSPGLVALQVAVFITIFLAGTNRLYISENKHRSFGLGAEMDYYPVRCIDWIRAHHPKGPMFNNLGLGGYLIYTLYPDYKVFIDGRLEVHTEAFYSTYREAMNHPENGWDNLQAQYGFGWAILSHSAGSTDDLIRYLYHRPDWVLVCIDGAAVVFVETLRSGNDDKPIDLKDWLPDEANSDSIPGFSGFFSPLERIFNRRTPHTLVMPFQLFSLGNLFMTLDRPEKAAEMLELAVQRSPGLKILHNNLGLAYLRLGRPDAAIEAFERAASISPKDAMIQSNLGVAYGQKGWTEKAISAFKRSAALDPNYEEALNNLGAAYWQTGRLDEAIAAYKRALILRPDFADYYYAIAVLYDQKGDRKQAVIYARKAKALGLPDAEKILR